MSIIDVSQRPHFFEALDILNEIRRTGQPVPAEIPIESDDGVVVVVWKTDNLVEAEREMDAEFSRSANAFGTTMVNRKA